MTDRELLELAAKAAGIAIKVVIGDTFWRPDGIPWNPLADDGDALRLMVALRMDAITSGGRTTVYYRGLSATEYHGDDPCAATRRAIVRAAAEIQRAKEPK